MKLNSNKLMKILAREFNQMTNNQSVGPKLWTNLEYSLIERLHNWDFTFKGPNEKKYGYITFLKNKILKQGLIIET